MKNLMTKPGIIRATVISVFTLTLASCASNTNVNAVTSDTSDLNNGLVVRDFLVAISQTLPPILTTVQLNAPASDFGKELEKGFREVGYGLQRVSSDQGPMFLSFSKSISETSANVSSTAYKIVVGDIGFERTYVDLASGAIAPAGPMVVHGSDKPVTLNPDLFPGQSMEVTFSANDRVELEPNAISILDGGVMTAISQLRGNELPSYKSLNFQNQEIENLFNKGASNFESIDDSFRTVRKDIIIFDNDSLTLRSDGRLQIDMLMKFYNPDTDVFRLVGCSIGHTNREGGNAELALGRSERVAQELVSRSVELASIFDEGCWAPAEGEEDYPSRAVVVQLQRRS